MRLTRQTCALLFLAVAACDQRSGDHAPVSSSRTAGAEAGLASAGRRGRITAEGKIISDTFEIRHDLQGNRLTVSLETDLPDQTALMVDVQRTYRTREGSDEYVIEYLSERSTVGAWRASRTLTINNEDWKRQLEEKRRILAVAGEPFTVRDISDTLEISFTVPVNQGPPFEPRNENLEGRVVETTEYGLRVISRDIPLHYPIDESDLDRSQWADPLNLRPGQSYALARATPLMPEIEPTDPLVAIARIQQMPAGTHVRVLEVRSRGGSPWYRVRVTAGQPMRAEGWINSTALIGLEIKEVES